LVDDFNQAKARQGKVLNKHIQACLVWLGLVGFLALIWTVSKQNLLIHPMQCLFGLIDQCLLIDWLLGWFVHWTSNKKHRRSSQQHWEEKREAGWRSGWWNWKGLVGWLDWLLYAWIEWSKWSIVDEKTFGLVVVLLIVFLWSIDRFIRSMENEGGSNDNEMKQQSNVAAMKASQASDSGQLVGWVDGQHKHIVDCWLEVAKHTNLLNQGWLFEKAKGWLVGWWKRREKAK